MSVVSDRPADHTLAFLRRLDAKLDRLEARLDDHTGRLQRLEQRYGRVQAPPAAGAAVAGPLPGLAALPRDRVLVRLDEIERRLRRLEDGIF